VTQSCGTKSSAFAFCFPHFSYHKYSYPLAAFPSQDEKSSDKVDLEMSSQFTIRVTENNATETWHYNNWRKVWTHRTNAECFRLLTLRSPLLRSHLARQFYWLSSEGRRHGFTAWACCVVLVIIRNSFNNGVIMEVWNTHARRQQQKSYINVEESSQNKVPQSVSNCIIYTDVKRLADMSACLWAYLSYLNHVMYPLCKCKFISDKRREWLWKN
jgi:hypothetical protein